MAFSATNVNNRTHCNTQYHVLKSNDTLRSYHCFRSYISITVIATAMDVPPPEENKEKNEGTKNEKGNAGNNSKPHNKKKEKSEAKASKPKKRDRGKKRASASAVGSHIFALDEIANNKEASALISDLVKCYTSNSTLPEEELSVLNKTLYEKTVSLFLHILNNCIDKIFNKLLSSDSFRDRFSNKNVKNAMCQTDISYSDN